MRLFVKSVISIVVLNRLYYILRGSFYFLVMEHHMVAVFAFFGG